MYLNPNVGRLLPFSPNSIFPNEHYEEISTLCCGCFCKQSLEDTHSSAESNNIFTSYPAELKRRKKIVEESMQGRAFWGFDQILLLPKRGIPQCEGNQEKWCSSVRHIDNHFGNNKAKGLNARSSDKAHSLMKKKKKCFRTKNSAILLSLFMTWTSLMRKQTSRKKFNCLL
ncbi:hypothetical protein M9H77_22644 [Catharanthus roseus]|uniref:Uncharacterized protein n=1 Tax=Catharanthus roseus TaxID=4058 RepID=A0ACC0ARS8_CATRO|nr:hypothetical protein M9H77_22644 [Catharanthus roseus]